MGLTHTVFVRFGNSKSLFDSCGDLERDEYTSLSGHHHFQVLLSSSNPFPAGLAIKQCRFSSCR